MTATSFDAHWPVIRRAARTVVVVDVVESVRLMELDEEDFVRRWQAFVGEVKTGLLPKHGGRLVKSLGDGLMVEFEAVPPAIQCAIDMQTAIAQTNLARSADRWIALRVGGHVTDVFVDEHDIYGAGVNLAARLTTLAGPGEIVVSADVRDRLTPGLDAEVEDLGECYLKHVQAPIRAYRVGAVGAAPIITHRGVNTDHAPIIAVIPLTVQPADSASGFVGDIIADDIIAALSTSDQWKVISRLSSAAFRSGLHQPVDLHKYLNATYVLSGVCHVVGQKLRVIAELADVRAETVVWSGSVAANLASLTDPDGELAATIAAHVGRAIFSHELGRTRAKPMPTLESYSLLFSSIALMHRLSKPDFERSRAMLEHLIERHPRAPAPKVWMGKWHVMNVVQGWSSDLVAEHQMARAWVQRALNDQPDHALGLAIDGLVSGYLGKDLDTAEARYAAALAVNPNESLAWLFSSALLAYRERGAEAAEAALRARTLSPLDPLKYYYDSFAAHALVAAGRYKEAIALGQESLRANCTHSPTLRTVAIAQVLDGQIEDARQTVRRFLSLEPRATVSAYRERYPGGASRDAVKYAQALRLAGLPES